MAVSQFCDEAARLGTQFLQNGHSMVIHSGSPPRRRVWVLRVASMLARIAIEPDRIGISWHSPSEHQISTATWVGHFHDSSGGTPPALRRVH